MLYLSVINDRISKFFIKNASIIYKFIAIIIVIVALVTFSNRYKKRKEIISNQKLFDIINNNNSDVKLLEDLYKNGMQTNSNSKAFAGLILAKEYTKNNKVEDAIKIYDYIHGTVKDNFIKDFAGYNLFKLSTTVYDSNKILNIYNSLISEDNRMHELIKEQYSLYLLKHNRIEEAKIILKSIQKNENNVDLFNRIKLYKKAYKF